MSWEYQAFFADSEGGPKHISEIVLKDQPVGSSTSLCEQPPMQCPSAPTTKKKTNAVSTLSLLLLKYPTSHWVNDKSSNHSNLRSRQVLASPLTLVCAGPSPIANKVWFHQVDVFTIVMISICPQIYAFLSALPILSQRSKSLGCQSLEVVAFVFAKVKIH